MITIKKVLSSAKYTFFASLFLVFVTYMAIYLLFFNTSNDTSVSIIEKKDFFTASNANDFGTAIAGIIGTCITIIGFSFIYFAYTNQQQQEEMSLFNKLYDDLLNDINSIQYRKKTGSGIGEQMTGMEALYNYAADDDINDNSVLNHMNLILLNFRILIEMVDRHKFQKEYFEKIMRNKIYTLFYSKFFWPTFNGIYSKYRIKLLSNGWGNAKILFYEYEKFTKEAFTYLVENDEIVVEGNSLLSSIMVKKFTSWQAHWQKYPVAPMSNVGAGYDAPKTPPNRLGKFVSENIIHHFRRLWHWIGYK